MGDWDSNLCECVWNQRYGVPVVYLGDGHTPNISQMLGVSLPRPRRYPAGDSPEALRFRQVPS